MNSCLSLILLTILAAACQTPSRKLKARAIPDLDQGPRVDEIVRTHQDQWLKGLVLDPDTLGIQTLVVLGDSYSDTGGLYQRSTNIGPPEIYWRSRFSNGPIWVDYVQGALAWKVRNYTFVDVTSTELEGIPSTSLAAQIYRFTKEAKSMNKEEVLVSLWLGPDFYVHGPKSASVVTAMKELKSAVTELNLLGFSRIAIGNMPELMEIPWVQSPWTSESQKELWSKMSSAHNEALKLLVEQLRKEQLSLKIFVFQTFEMQKLVHEKMDGILKSKAGMPCYQGNVFGQFTGERVFCKDPQQKFYWDVTHPSTKQHCFYAAQFLADLADSEFISGYNKGQAVDHCQQL